MEQMNGDITVRVQLRNIFSLITVLNMKIVVPFLLFVSTFTSCDKKHLSKESDKIQNTFAVCFANVDTTKVGQSISCGNGVYKLINEKYVLWVSLRFPVQYDSCYIVTIDSLNGIGTAQLVFYPQDKATLADHCNDIIICNNPIPTKTLIAERGQLLIGFSNPTMLQGYKTQHTSVLIKNLVFVDKDTGEKIEIKNELIWKVLYLGTPC